MNPYLVRFWDWILYKSGLLPHEEGGDPIPIPPYHPILLVENGGVLPLPPGTPPAVAAIYDQAAAAPPAGIGEDTDKGVEDAITEGFDGGEVEGDIPIVDAELLGGESNDEEDEEDEEDEDELDRKLAPGEYPRVDDLDDEDAATAMEVALSIGDGFAISKRGLAIGTPHTGRKPSKVAKVTNSFGGDDAMEESEGSEEECSPHAGSVLLLGQKSPEWSDEEKDEN